MDGTRRAELLRLASTLISEDVAVIPLYFQRAVWADRSGLTFTPRPDEHT